MNGQTGTKPKSGPPGGSEEIGVLLGGWAHPDDEAYLTDGPKSVVRAAGHQVAGATATVGELGTGDPVALLPDRLALIRERESAASLAVLEIQAGDPRVFMRGERPGNTAGYGPSRVP